MMPIYRHIDSYPYQSEKVLFDQNYQPCLEVVPPRMGMFPVTYQSWPYGGNYGYPIPQHACFNHHDSPAGYYSARPPHPHFLPVASSHCCGNYPAFPGYAPVPYVPPPDYSMEKPRYYEYEKNAVKNNHCCGCPNHNNNQKEDRSVKTEEQEADVGKKCETLVPLQLKNYQYPFMWVPAECLKNEAGKRHLESEIKDHDKTVHDMKSPANLKLEPRDWDTVDLRGLRPLVVGGDGNRSQNQLDADKVKQFPFLWMPSHDAGKKGHEEKEEYKKMNSAPQFDEQSPRSCKVFPAKLPNGDDSVEKYRATENDSGNQTGSNVLEKTANQKQVPVKQMEPQMGKNIKIEKKVKEVSVKDSENKTTTENKTCPQKTTKLPPVCLRVDPLPRRKTGNGNSRSPSPPARKGDTEKGSCGSFKVSDPSNLEENVQQGSQPRGSTSDKEREPNLKERISMEVMNLQTAEKRDGDPHTKSPAMLPNDTQQGISSCPTEKYEKDDNNCNTEENMSSKEAAGERNLAKHMVERKTLSDEEASLLIQSAYRGFEVRKWEPLKKLRQIVDVRKQVVEVRNHIHALESSSKIKKDDRKKVFIEEKIMNLLLKLDSVQGLHPSLREIRKSLARELITLQERLDSLVSKKSEDKIEEVPAVQPVHVSGDTLDDAPAVQPVHVSGDTFGDAPKEERQGMEVGLGNDFSECTSDNSLIEKLHPTAPLTNSHDVPDKEVEGSEHENGARSDVAHTVETGQADNEGLDAMQVATVDIKEESDDIDQSVRVLAVTEGKDDTEVDLSCNVSNAEGEVALVEAKNETTRADLDLGNSSDSVKDEQTHMGGNMVEDGGEITSPSLDLDSPPMVENSAHLSKHPENNSHVESSLEATIGVDFVVPVLKQQEQVMDKNEVSLDGDSLSEINTEGSPSIVIEDPLVPMFEKLEQAATGKDEVLHGENSECVELTSLDNSSCIQNQVEQQPLEAYGEALLTAEAGDLKEVELPQMEVKLPDEVHNEGTHESVVYINNSELAEENQASAIDRPAEITETEEELQASEADNGPKQSNEHENGENDLLIMTSLNPVGALSVGPAVEVLDTNEQSLASDTNRKLTEENEKLKEMMEKLIRKGEEKLTAISDLTGRVKDLEKKLSRRKTKTRGRRNTRAAASWLHAY